MDDIPMKSGLNEVISISKDFIIQAICGFYMSYYHISGSLDLKIDIISGVLLPRYMNIVYHEYNLKTDKYIGEVYGKIMNLGIFKNTICLTHIMYAIILGICSRFVINDDIIKKTKDTNVIRKNIYSQISMFMILSPPVFANNDIKCCGKDIKYDGKDIFIFLN